MVLRFWFVIKVSERERELSSAWYGDVDNFSWGFGKGGQKVIRLFARPFS